MGVREWKSVDKSHFKSLFLKSSGSLVLTTVVLITWNYPIPLVVLNGLGSVLPKTCVLVRHF